jgi:hypothetical protein
MIARLDLCPTDRLLLLSIPDAGLVAELARRLERGSLVGLGNAEEVQAARSAARDLVNTMFQPGRPEEIPWQNGFFSRVVDLRGGWENPATAAREVARVLTPGGLAYLPGIDRLPLMEAGLIDVSPGQDLQVYQKPG